MKFTARRLPVQSGPAAWNELLPQRKPGPVLEDAQTADFAIIGAGFAGLSAARRLAQLQPGAKIAVLEAAGIAEGPSGRNSGFMIDLPHDLSSDYYGGDAVEADRTQTELNRHAIAFAKDAAAEYGLGRDALDPCGKINAAATPAGDRHNRDYAAHLSAMNEGHELLDATAMARITGTGHYSSGLYTPGAVMLQPAAYIRGLAAGVSRIAALHENSPVTAITREGTAWRLDTPKGRISAGRVIMAANGHAASFGFYPQRLMQVFTYGSMTEAFDPARLGGDPRWGVTASDPLGTSVRRIVTGGQSRLLIRTRFTYNPSMSVSAAAVARAGRLHDRKFAERFPMLSGVRMQYRWAGHLCVSRNGVPAFGEIAPGIFSACCQNGLGTTKGTLAGIAAAELATGTETEQLRMLRVMPEPQRLPPEPLSWIGANAYMRWKEWRSGRE